MPLLPLLSFSLFCICRYWEIHEIFRKNLLIGVVGFLPQTTRAAAAILICVIAVAFLNYSIPQRNRLIFVICEACFITTTFKYLGAVLLRSGGATTEDEQMLGTMLVVLDVATMLGGILAAIAILLNVGLRANKMTKKTTEVMPVQKSRSSGGVGTSVVVGGGGGEGGDGGDSSTMTKEMKLDLKNWKA